MLKSRLKRLSSFASRFVWLLIFPSLLCAESSPLKVGVSLPLSGVAAEFGDAVKNGIEMAMAESPNEFANVRIIYEDNQYDAKRALVAYQKLRTSDKIDLCFMWGEAPALAVAPIAEKEHFPLIALSTDPESLRKFSFVVRFINSQSYYAEKLVGHLRKLGYKRIGVVMADDPYYEAYVQAIRRHLRQDESLTIIANYQQTEADFRTSLLKIKQSDFDAVGVFIFVGQISGFYRQARQLGLTFPTFGGDDFESKTEMADSHGGMDGAVFALNSIDQKFAQRYFVRFGNDGHLTYAANGYEFARTMSRLAAGFQPKETAQGLLKRLSMLPVVEGVLGQMEYTESQEDGKYFRFPIVVNKIVDGRVVVVDR